MLKIILKHANIMFLSKCGSLILASIMDLACNNYYYGFPHYFYTYQSDSSVMKR